MTAAIDPWTLRWSRLVAQVRIVEDAAEERLLVRELVHTPAPRVLAFINAHAMNSAAEQSEFFDALAGADVLLRDGAGMAQLYRRVDQPAGLNMNGTDFIPQLLAAAAGRRVALWGTREPHLSAAAAAVEARYGVRPVSLADGFQPPEHYVDLLSSQDIDLVVLGMGMPKQEKVAQMLRDATTLPVLIVCGGAIIDFLGGKVPRAPQWMRRLGLEWLYRLAREPRRLFKRYVVGNPLFLWRVRRWCKAQGLE